LHSNGVRGRLLKMAKRKADDMSSLGTPSNTAVKWRVTLRTDTGKITYETSAQTAYGAAANFGMQISQCDAIERI
jgi:hypothetical protein